MVLLLGRKRFRELPDDLVAMVNEADAAWCEGFAERLLSAASLEELL